MQAGVGGWRISPRMMPRNGVKSGEAAWREAQQAFAFKAQPMTICAYAVDCDDVADLTEPAGRAGLGVGPSDMGGNWEDMASRGLVPPSWVLARRLFATGLAAVIVPSFAPGALPSDRNIVFWRWGDRRRTRFG